MPAGERDNSPVMVIMLVIIIVVVAV